MVVMEKALMISDYPTSNSPSDICSFGTWEIPLRQTQAGHYYVVRECEQYLMPYALYLC